MNSFGNLQAYWKEGRNQHKKESEGMGKEEEEEESKTLKVLIFSTYHKCEAIFFKDSPTANYIYL